MLGAAFGVEMYSRANGKGFALTRYTTEDVIITYGVSAEDAFSRHSIALPLAVGSRIKQPISAGRETAI